MQTAARGRYTLECKQEAVRLHGQRFEAIRATTDETIAWLLW